MCGIFGILNKDYSNNKSDLIKHRGPDNTVTKQYPKKYFFCFHRLSINDLSDSGNQPFETDDYIIMCNGEIYNYEFLIKTFDLNCTSKSDCEVICKLYEIHNIEQLAKCLDGVFSISIYDKKKQVCFLIRDRIGIRPLYYSVETKVKEDNDICLSFASEGKCLEGNILQLPPATILTYDILENNIYYDVYYKLPVQSIQYNENIICKKIEKCLNNAVSKRLLSDRPIGCLLSGGLDSSLIASLLSKKSLLPIKTFSVGFEDSEDLIYARQVADHLRTDHYELKLNYEDTLKRIPEIIQSIETYDITTVRASICMYCLSEYIQKNHKEVVIFSGEGADELFAGYLYFHKAPNASYCKEDTIRLIKNLPYFDVLRSDRCTAKFGLEVRVPFLDRDLVDYVISLDGRHLTPRDGIEKYILRRAFSHNTDWYLPKSVLWRKKEAFSDGVGGIKKPFYKHIQEFIKTHDYYKDLHDDDCEKEYYYNIYHQFYSYPSIPYYWLPKWVNTRNPSARIIEI